MQIIWSFSSWSLLQPPVTSSLLDPKIFCSNPFFQYEEGKSVEILGTPSSALLHNQRSLCLDACPQWQSAATLPTPLVQFKVADHESFLYRVIHKSLRDFRPLRYSNRYGNAEGEHVNRGRDTPSFCPTLQVLDMSTLGDAARVKFGNFGKFQDTERVFIPWLRHVSSRLPPSDKTCKYATAPSTQKETWRDSLLIYMLLSAVSALVVARRSSKVPEGLMNNPVYELLSL
jgi:hypothetical protein